MALLEPPLYIVLIEDYVITCVYLTKPFFVKIERHGMALLIGADFILGLAAQMTESTTPINL